MHDVDNVCNEKNVTLYRHEIGWGAARGSVHCVRGSAACALARGGWGITSVRKHQLASVERHHIVIKVTLRCSRNNVLVKRLFNVYLTLIKRRLNVILTKFKRYSNVISTSLSPKGMSLRFARWRHKSPDSPGGDTKSTPSDTTIKSSELGGV